MNNIITLKKLVELLSRATGLSTETTNEYVMAYTSLIAETLAKGEAVKIKGVGTFTVIEGKIDFHPDPELSEAVNAPFAMFSPEPLDALTTDAQLQDAAALAASAIADMSQEATSKQHEAQTPAHAEPQQMQQKEETEQTQQPIPPIDNVVAAEQNQPEAPLMPASDEPVAPIQTAIPTEQSQSQTEQPQSQTEHPQNQPEIEDDQDSSYEEYEPQQTSSSFRALWVIWGLVIGLLLGIFAGFFAHDPIQEWLEPSIVENAEEEEDLQAEIDALAAMLEIPLDDEALSEEPEAELQNSEPEMKAEPEMKTEPEKKTEPEIKTEPEKKAEPKVVYDEIKPGVTLNSLAKKHYGEKAYWVYIYMENKATITNPDLIPVNTKLIIPPLSKYATQATEAQKKEAANKLAAQILSKKKK